MIAENKVWWMIGTALLAATPALAQDSGSANETSWNVNPEINRGKVQTRQYTLKLEGGAYIDSQDKSGFTGEAKAEARFLLGYQADPDDESTLKEMGFVFAPGVEGRVDLAGGELRKLDVKAGRIVPLRIFAANPRKVMKYGEGALTSYEGAKLLSDTREYCQDSRVSPCVALREAMLGEYRVREEKIKTESHTVAEQNRKMEELNQWQEAEERRISATEIRVRTYELPPSATFGVEFGGTQYRYYRSNRSQVEANGAQIDIVRLGAAGAFKIGDAVQLDGCLEASVGGHTGVHRWVGEHESKSSPEWTGQVQACGGITVADTVRVGYQFGVEAIGFDSYAPYGASSVTQSHAVSLELKKGPVPVQVVGTHEIESTNNLVPTVHTNMVRAGVSW